MQYSEVRVVCVASIAVVGETRGLEGGGSDERRKRDKRRGDDANAGREGERVEWGRTEEGREERTKRRHIGNNEGEGYVCVALSA